MGTVIETKVLALSDNLYVFLDSPYSSRSMRPKRTPLVLCALLTWILCSGIQVSAKAIQAPPDKFTSNNSDQAQINAGDVFLKDRAFKEAEAAYSKALQSVDPKTREKALHSLERSLRHRRDSGVLVRETLHGAVESVTRALPVVLCVFLLCWVAGWLGKCNGRKHCVVEDLDTANPGFAKTFHLAYLKALDERRSAHWPRPGLLGSRTVTAAVWTIPSVEKDIGETALVQLVSLASQDIGKVASVLVARFRRPRLRLRVALFDDAPLMLIGLQDKGHIIQVWSEPIGTSDLFKPRSRLLREIVEYVEQRIRTKQT